MDLSFIADLFGGGAIGGALGAITPLVANAQKRKQLAEDNKHELALGEIGLRELKISQDHSLLIADKQIDIAESETAGEVSLKELDIDLANVLGQSKLTGAIAWVRPALTGFLLLMLSVFTGWVIYVVGGIESLDDGELVDILRLLITALITMSMASVMFWFTARQISK